MLTAESVKLHTKFIPDGFTVDTWENLEPYFRKLGDAQLNSVQELEEWLGNLSELESVLHEELAWRYVKSTCNTADKEAEAAYDFFVSEIDPKTAPWFQKLNEKLVASPFAAQLDPKKYFVYLREVKNDIKLYRAENIPLFTRIDQLAQQYGKIAGEQSIEYEGKELTMPQAFSMLRSTDENIRRDIFEKVWKRRGEDRVKLDQLFSDLAAIRHNCALNCGFENFRDYSFAIMGRFDYTKEDCFNFHNAIAQYAVPLMELKRRMSPNACC